MLPAPLQAAVAVRLEALAASRIIERIWARDHTVWQPHPAECADRLGWLTVPHAMFGRMPAFAALRDELVTSGIDTLLLLGMGGSSLAPEVMTRAFGPVPGSLRFELLDSTDPRQLASTLASINLDRTVIAVSSKSGTTIETRSHFAFFRERLPDPRRYIVITDPGTPLEREAEQHGIARLFLNPPDLGGRFSALSNFGLLPAALCGVDVPALLGRVGPMMQACREPHPSANPGAWLGAVIAEAALAGRDKLTLFFPEQVEALGHWIEQLVAESTGKRGRGILPVEAERIGPPSVYGEDRLFVAYGPLEGLEDLEAAGHPVVRLPAIGPVDLGAEFFRWEFATAVAGHILGINPFDQPNVEEAKQLTRRVLAGEPIDDTGTANPSEVLRSISPGDYLAILAYLPHDRATTARLEQARHSFRSRYRVATTVGFGPRYLHSTGQLHKGGPPTGVFLLVEDPAAIDFPVPGEQYTFAALEAAQARGDVAALKHHGRRVARLSLAELEDLAAHA